MSDEIRAAAERMRTGEHVLYSGAWRDDAVVLIAAYLAEHPADDGVAIDEAWLRSVGVNPSPESAAHWYWKFPGAEDEADLVRWAGGWNVRIPSGHNCKTRGDIRRLTKALNINLKGVQ